MACLDSCSKSTMPRPERESSGVPAPAEEVDPTLELHSTVSLRVFQGGGVPLFSFYYSGRLAKQQLPRISELIIDKVGLARSFCSLKSTDLTERLLAGSWRFGDRPTNYAIEGCNEPIGPGEYEVYIYSRGSEGRHRLEVSKQGRIQVLPWETEETATAAKQQIEEAMQRSKRDAESQR